MFQLCGETHTPYVFQVPHLDKTQLCKGFLMVFPAAIISAKLFGKDKLIYKRRFGF